MKKILVVFAHPYPIKSRGNKLILERIRTLPNVVVSDLYEKYPYFHINVKEEQDLLIENDVIVFQHPLYWYSMPPLLKLWYDEVLEYGFAYGPGGNALKGKDFLLSLTTGGAQGSYTKEGYNQFELKEFLPAFIQTARLCQMNWYEPLVLHNANRAPIEVLEAHAEKVRQTLVELSNTEFNRDL